MTIRIIFALLTILSSLSLAETKPNIIFILADDLGYGDLGCYGQKKTRTPNIDKLAAEGMRFTHHYSGQTVCSPSRASLMLGQHMGRCRITKNGGSLKKEETTIAQLLQKAGYHTGMIGKWGLEGAPNHPGSPNNKGFDHWFGFHSQGMAHFFYPEFLWRNTTKIEYPENVNVRENGYYKEGKGKHAHDLFAAEAEWFIRENKDRPFFLYIPFAIPHAELIVPSDDPDLSYYKSLGWPEKVKAEGGGGGKGKAGYGTKFHKGYCAQDHPHATYAAMISRMDRSVGRLMALLKKLELDKNTLVIFSSDNGPSSEGGQTLEFFKSQGILRGYKRSIYEGGTRVPMIAHWPGKIKAGTVSGHPCGFHDVMPTLCELAETKPTASTTGISYLPELLGKKQATAPYLYYRWLKIEAIRVGKWKLIRSNKSKTPNYELYDLEADPSETNNQASSKLDLISTLLPHFDHAVGKK